MSASKSVENTLPTLLIPDEIIATAGPCMSWLGIDGFGLYAHKPINSKSPDAPSSAAPCEIDVHVVEPNTILNVPELRKLVNESNTTFTSTKSMAVSQDNRSVLLSFSREHRSSIRNCMDNMINEAPDSLSGKNDWLEILGNIELIWHLVELFHIDVVPGDIVLPRLVEWIRFHSGDYDEEVSPILLNSHASGADLRYEKYWEYVFYLLLEGRFEAARALLRLHSEADTTPFLELDMILRGIPVYNIYCGLSTSEFNVRWRGWKSSVRAKLNSGIFQAHPKLMEIIKILGGDEPLFDVLKKHCKTWYHMMTSMLIFTDPTVKLQDLCYHANQCISHYGGHINMKTLDYAIFAIFDSDIDLTIQKLLLTSDGGWSAVHLGNLLYLNRTLKTTGKNAVNMESIILDYGTFLTSNIATWKIGLSYLEHCPTHGKSIMETLLLKLPLENDKMALKVINAAKEYNLPNVVHSVAKSMGIKYMQRKHYGSALTWALQSGDSDFATFLADFYLSKYATEAELGCADFLSNLGQSVLLSDRLTFLAKYCEFHKLYQQGEIKEASVLLIRLLESKIAPKYFWLTLLTDALPLLSHDQGLDPLFSHDDTTVLLACLEELTIDFVESHVSKTTNFNETVQLLRVAVAKNLSKTLMIESRSPLPKSRVIKCE